ncbi:uncharacterized protein A4U43_C04F7460 [Asparagus officinalis]|uniref:U-box domain-containing protein n=1 Tax=Asparagus officinalis TaxID=4686 RepID=A0A5P1F3H3_ASPOF|nr:E3 ubiquitin-protein ligase PUB23-like [Asparagus officinalis]ONK71339.1 uncharacterized protein A4U43_C04F7460 [Asparagus officinalis]
MAEHEIPSYFLCPISYQIMKDPVTLSTGITYDRSSIQQWIFAGKHDTCPVTNQLLSSRDLTPNHTLRRLIQAWCVANAVERVPTPRQPIDRAHIARIVDKARSSTQFQLSCLQQLKSIASESEINRSCIENSEAVEFLASVVSISGNNNGCDDSVNEALEILSKLQISDQALIDLVSRFDDLIDSLTKILNQSNHTSRTNALILLKSIVQVISPARLMAVREDLFLGVVKILRDKISIKATKSALETLIGVCSWGRNRIKASRSGAVHVLIEILIDCENERRVNEMALVVLDKLSSCAEGRAEIVKHAAGIAAVSRSILRVSATGNERAVRVLWSVARYSATAAVVQEMMQVGAVAKL